MNIPEFAVSLFLHLLIHRVRAARKTIHRVKTLPLFVFAKELVHNPRKVGAACPSSKKLAESLASYITNDVSGYIIELGAGTGVVTSALLDRGLDPRRLIVVERSASLTALLRQKFPEVLVLQGDAAGLEELLYQQAAFAIASISGIVSSLPLRSLPRTTVERILQQVGSIVASDGQLIQFTYDIRPSKALLAFGFAPRASKIIWRNLPPARIEIFTKNR